MPGQLHGCLVYFRISVLFLRVSSKTDDRRGSNFSVMTSSPLAFKALHYHQLLNDILCPNFPVRWDTKSKSRQLNTLSNKSLSSYKIQTCLINSFAFIPLQFVSILVVIMNPQIFPLHQAIAGILLLFLELGSVTADCMVITYGEEMVSNGNWCFYAMPYADKALLKAPGMVSFTLFAS